MNNNLAARKKNDPRPGRDQEEREASPEPGRETATEQNRDHDRDWTPRPG